ncbi:MAG: tRNA(Phe) 7-((3-amino-3-carboxypropyl)-4-demethylwyosine(37)-N(4))-methyltransferase [Candidatus Methanospirareceae archaeon]
MVNEGIFLERKRRALERLREEGADEDVRDIIEKINSHEDFFTTSSCSGRIILLHLPAVGAKKEARFLGKWHRTVTKEEVMEVLGEDFRSGEIWFISQSPIIHAVARHLEAAERLLKVAISAGFKYSGIKSLRDKIVVEIISTERMDVPLGKGGVLFCDEAYIDFLVERANFLLLRGKDKLKRLKNGIEKW